MVWNKCWQARDNYCSSCNTETNKQINPDRMIFFGYEYIHKYEYAFHASAEVFCFELFRNIL